MEPSIYLCPPRFLFPSFNQQQKPFFFSTEPVNQQNTIKQEEILSEESDESEEGSSKEEEKDEEDSPRSPNSISMTSSGVTKKQKTKTIGSKSKFYP